MIMAWITPKTDWKAEYDGAGEYVADFFNIEDYNRIKNNLMYLREIGGELFYPLPTITVGADKHYPIAGSPDFDNDNFFADEINLIEDGLDALDQAIGLFQHGNKSTFYENGRFIGFAELNRIESAELELYEYITDSIAGKSHLAIRFGERENAIRV
jgi:hypothetical protein